MTMEKVCDILLTKNHFFNNEKMKQIVDEYFKLNFDLSYFNNYSAEEIAEHVEAYAISIADTHNSKRHLKYSREEQHRAFFFCESEYNAQQDTLKKIQAWLKLSEKYFETHAISIASYTSQTEMKRVGVTFFAIELNPYINPTGKSKKIAELTSEKFSKTKSPSIAQDYDELMTLLAHTFHPLWQLKNKSEGVKSIKMAFYSYDITYFTYLISLINRIPGIVVFKKFAESFSNGVHIYSFYTKNISTKQLKNTLSYVTIQYMITHPMIGELYHRRVITENELLYSHVLSYFVFYFTPAPDMEDYSELDRFLKQSRMGVFRLRNLRGDLFRQIMSMHIINEVICDNIGIIQQLYHAFESNDDVLHTKIEADMRTHLINVNLFKRSIMETILLFNKSVIQTNFFRAEKICVNFRLDPEVFFGRLDYPRVPFAIFLVVGTQFVGFHVRFTDIARGGIRIILSRNQEAYQKNKVNLFKENYNLAYAQLLKNKDIPEGGSKGVILVYPNRSSHYNKIFLQYVDAMMDMLIPNVEDIRSKRPLKEILFFGPDENTAGEQPGRAALHAKERGYASWKSLTTGKDSSLGGIPHDEYSMTTMGVRAAATFIYEKLKLDGTKLKKFQTGGPDGDLGGNEIKHSNEIYIGIVDGSGVLYDPNGLKKEELIDLATKRVVVSYYNKSLISSQGFFVAVNETNRTLPDGTVIESGERFRNLFHFSKYAVADIFITCGGRPSSINLSNVHELVMGIPNVTSQSMIEKKIGNLRGTNKLRFKYIVEGANLFITQDARVALESVGVVLLKDAVVNKGGVTSSSFEVLAGLAMTDEEHKVNMCFEKGQNPPVFYEEYVKFIQKRIVENCRKELDCIWAERCKFSFGGIITYIADEVSRKIVSIRQFISESTLHTNDLLYTYILKQYLPKILVDKVGLDNICKRVPPEYLKAIFAIKIASDYVYSMGITKHDFGFFLFISDLEKKAKFAQGEDISSKL